MPCQSFSECFDSLPLFPPITPLPASTPSPPQFPSRHPPAPPIPPETRWPQTSPLLTVPPSWAVTAWMCSLYSCAIRVSLRRLCMLLLPQLPLCWDAARLAPSFFPYCHPFQPLLHLPGCSLSAHPAPPPAACSRYHVRERRRPCTQSHPSPPPPSPHCAAPNARPFC